ncbi:hypothetical protein [Halorussus sp. AFM4]|uniref:hypothetical protein n=1 Tax=Halorussus sp. AFM4 TaxID=3421651 RepID=UPI003EBD4B81
MKTDEYEVAREEVGSHRTHWHLRDVATGHFTDFSRWKEMWYWQVGLKPSGKVTSRGVCDEDSRRDKARKLSIAEAFGGQLGLTESQLGEVRSILLQINVDRLGYYSNNRVAALTVIDGVTKERRQYAEWDKRRRDETTLVSPPRTVEKLFEDVYDGEDGCPEDRAMQFAKAISETYGIDAGDIQGARKAIRDNTHVENFGSL